MVLFRLALIALVGCSANSENPTPSPSEPAQFPSVEAFDVEGPYDTVIDDINDCTVHRPAELGTAGLAHPIVLWGNGTTATPAVYAELLAHLASHGFVVAAANTSNAGSGAEMLDCLDELTVRQGETGDAYFEWLDLTSVGASGHSQGGAGALMVGAEPGVRTSAPLQPYIDPIPFGGRFEREALANQTGPLALFSGGSDQIASPDEQQQPVFDEANIYTVWATLLSASHFEPIGDAGRYRGPLTAWFRSELMDDVDARARFEGACALCDDADWTLETNDVGR
ncbi:MAG: alpha/beta hydrolase [Myxococcota bacterium]